MEKIQNTSTMVKQNRSELKRQYTISVAKKDSGFQARATLKVIGGAKNPRITAYSGISPSDAVCKILNKMAERLIEYRNMSLLKKEICLNIYDSIMISIQDLNLTSNSEVMESATAVFKILTSINNTNIPTTIYPQSNIYQNNNQSVQFNNVFQTSSITLEEKNKLEFFEQNQVTPVISKDFETVALEWFEHEKSLTEKSEDNPKPLSPKTVQGYNSPLTDVLIPYFKDKQICFITEQNIKELINSINGYRTKEIVYIVLKMLFDFAREKNYIFYTPRISVFVK